MNNKQQERLGYSQYVYVYKYWNTGWWFGTFFIFPYIGNTHPNWLSYFSEGFKPPTRIHHVGCTSRLPHETTMPVSPHLSETVWIASWASFSQPCPSWQHFQHPHFWTSPLFLSASSSFGIRDILPCIFRTCPEWVIVWGEIKPFKLHRGPEINM